MHLCNWERHAELYPCSWYFEAPQYVLDSYGLQHGNIIRVLLDNICYLCIAHRRDRPKITIGGCISLAGDPIADISHDSSKQVSEISVVKISSDLIYNSNLDHIVICLPSAFRHNVIRDEAITIIKTLLHGAPYLHDTWMNIFLAMTKLRVRIVHVQEGAQKALNSSHVADTGLSFTATVPQCSWIGCTAVRDKLQYCVTSPSISHFLVAGPRGSGKMTLLKDCLHKMGQFSSLIVSANDLIEGKHLCNEYTSDPVWPSVSNTASHRIQPQVAEGYKQEFFSSYSDFLRTLSMSYHKQADFSLLCKKRDAAQGKTTLSSALIDVIAKASMYDFLVIKEFDSVFVQRSDMASPEQRQLTSTLLMLLDGSAKQSTSAQCRCKYIGIVNDLTGVDTALRRPGRFEEVVTLSNPAFDTRTQFLRSVLAYRNDDLDSSLIDLLTKATSSMPLGDIRELLTACAGIDRVHLVETVQQHVQKFRGRNALELSNEISSCRVPDPDPLTPFKAVSVHDGILHKLNDTILLPILHKDLFWKLMRSQSSGNILCMGPAGSGKTFLVQRLIRQLSGRINFFELNCAQAFSLYVGHTEKNIRRAFQEARSNMPSVLILDNYDSLAENRDSGEASGDSVASRALTTLLVELDGLSTGTFGQVTVLAITSQPDKIDRALLRPGRIDHKIFIGHLPKEIIMEEKIWTEIKEFYNLSNTDVIALKDCIVHGYNSGCHITIGTIIRKSRLLASGAVSLEQVLDDLTKTMLTGS